jgi:hypothetical protein
MGFKRTINETAGTALHHHRLIIKPAWVLWNRNSSIVEE